MKITAIIPTWNRAHYLGEALESVLGQTLPPQEVIVVDDGSTDDTSLLMREKYPHITTVFRPHAGPAAARNAGLRIATGSHIAFLDSDDLWVPRKLEIQARLLRETPGPAMVFARYQEFSSPGTPANPVHYAGYCAGTLFLPREVFDGAGLFDERLLMGEFIEWYDRALHHGFGHVLLPDVLLKRRAHPGNLTQSVEGPSPLYTQALKIALDRRRGKQDV